MTELAKCWTCGADWSAGEFRAGCGECGGFAMRTPCLVCGGRCGAVFERAVSDSHDSGLAHWGGACRLPMEEQKEILVRRYREGRARKEI